MKRDMIARLHAAFEEIVQYEEDTRTEFWLARDLQQVLGYQNWENFAKVISKAVQSCQKAGYEPQDHFLEVRKMVSIGAPA
jgi:DNA-damage-inducible protein D